MRLFALFLFVLCLSVVSASGSAPAQDVVPAASSVSYLQLPGGAPWVVMPPVVAPVLGHLPTSALPHISPSTCSVDRGDAPPASCSTQPLDEWVICSAHYGTADECSVYDSGTANNDTLECSVFREVSSCSVLRAGIAQLPGLGASCSVHVSGQPPTGYSCSVFLAGSATTCSVKNPSADAGPLGNNDCSVMTGGANGEEHKCSILSGSTGILRKCTVGRPSANVGNACSVMGLNSRCSVAVGTKGACTAFQGADTASCSVISGALSTCSVIGGAQGSFCSQP